MIKRVLPTVLSALLFTSFHVFAQEVSIEESFFKKGQDFMNNRQYEKAYQEFDHAMAINPEIPKFPYSAGVARFYMKDVNGAGKLLEQAVSLDKAYEDAYNQLVKVYVKQKNYTKLVETWDRMALNLPDLPKRLDAKYNAVNFLIGQKEYDSALEQASDAIKINPEDIEALYLYAKTNNLVGNYEEAMNSAKKATELLTTSKQEVISKIYYELGYAYHFLGQYDLKNESFTKVLIPSFRPLMDKLSPDYFTSLAKSFDQIFEYEEAEKHLAEALKVDDYYKPANELRAKLTEHEHPKLEKIAYLKKAIEGILKKGATEQAETLELIGDYIQLIELKIQSKEYERALASADECLELFAQAPQGTHEIHFLKAVAMHKLDQTGGAIEEMKSVTSNKGVSSGEAVRYYFALGYMLKIQKEYDAAKNALVNAKGPFMNAAKHLYGEIQDELDMEKKKITAEAIEPGSDSNSN